MDLHEGKILFRALKKLLVTLVIVMLLYMESSRFQLHLSKVPRSL